MKILMQSASRSDFGALKLLNDTHWKLEICRSSCSRGLCFAPEILKVQQEIAICSSAALFGHVSGRHSKTFFFLFFSPNLFIIYLFMYAYMHVAGFRSPLPPMVMVPLPPVVWCRVVWFWIELVAGHGMPPPPVLWWSGLGFGFSWKGRSSSSGK